MAQETGEQKLKRQLEEVKLMERLTKATIANKDEMRNALDTMQKKLNVQRLAGKLTEEQIQQSQTEIDLRTQLIGKTEEQRIAILNAVQAQREDLKARLDRIVGLEKEIDLLKDGAGEFDNWANKVSKLTGFGMKFTQTWSGGLFNIGTKLKKVQKDFELLLAKGEKKGPIIEKYMKNLGDYMAGFAVEWVEDIIKQQDQLVAGFHKSTQASDEMSSSVLEASEALRQQGLGMEAAYKASEALIASSVEFKNATGGYRQEIIDTVAKLEIAGVSANTTAAAFDVFTKVLGKKGTAELKKFAKVAETLDVPLNQFYSEFVTASKQLASRGPQMEKIFVNLQAQVRATGASMDTLLGVAEKFDTFESSADSVARLNGILGGPYLNSVQMVMMAEDERIEAVRASLKQSGTVFKNLGHHARMSIMAAAGITDQAEATKFLGSTASEYKKIQKEAEIAAKKEKNLADMTKKAMTMAEELRLAFMGLVIEMKPFIESVTDAVSSFTGFVSGMSEGGKQIFFWTMLLGGLGLKFGVFKTLVFTIIPMLWTMGTALATVAAGTTAVGFAMKLAGFGVVLTILTGLIWAVKKLGEYFGWWGNEAEAAGEKVGNAMGMVDADAHKKALKQVRSQWAHSSPAEDSTSPLNHSGTESIFEATARQANEDLAKIEMEPTSGGGGAGGALGDIAYTGIAMLMKPITIAIVEALKEAGVAGATGGGGGGGQVVLKLNERELGSVLFDHPNGTIYSLNNDTGKKLNLGLARQTK